MTCRFMSSNSPIGPPRSGVRLAPRLRRGAARGPAGLGAAATFAATVATAPRPPTRLRGPAPTRGPRRLCLLCGVPGGPPRPRQPVGPPSFAASRGVTSPRPARPCRRTPSGRSVVASTPWRCEGPRAPRSRRGRCGPARGARRPPHSARGARPPRKSAEAPDAGRARPVLEPEGSGTLTCFWQRCMRSTIRSDVRAGHRPRGPRHRTRWLLIPCGETCTRPGPGQDGLGASEPPPRRRVSATRSPGR